MHISVHHLRQRLHRLQHVSCQLPENTDSPCSPPWDSHPSAAKITARQPFTWGI